MLVALVPLALAAIGLTHPNPLTAENAPWWTTMHVILVPLFPLLGVVVWMLLRTDRSALGWGGRVAALVYVVFYGVLDAVSGIAAGTVVQAGVATDSPVLSALYAMGSHFRIVGSYAFFVAVILVLASAWIAGRRGVLFYVAAVALVASGYLYTTAHIYFPKGTVTMIGFAVGFALLELIRARKATPVAS